ncbi:MAG: dienelactone hydrolase [Bacteroidales bacterium]|nr:MAG: dienelactone hydrolase [Bacteroidales bacterium]
MIFKILFTSIVLSPFYTFGQDYNVGEQTIIYTDSLRNRMIKTEIWYPTNETDSTFERKTDLPFVLSPTIRNAKITNQVFPLVVLSHGTGGNRFGLAWLAIALVKQGYIVISPDHWGNTFDNKIPEYFVRYWERPMDISFLLTHFLNDKPFSQQIDTSRIGMVGFSFGGYTSLALAGADLNCDLLKTISKTEQGKKEFSIPELGDLRKLVDKIPCENIHNTFKDNRIKAFVALAPALGLGFDNMGQTKYLTAPILIIGAENNRIAPIKSNAENYNKLIPHSLFIKLEGKIGHYVFINEGDESLKKEARTYYKDDKAINRKTIHRNVEKEIITFFQNTMNKYAYRITYKTISYTKKRRIICYI